MSNIDIGFGFLAGIVSCLTPGSWLLFPLAAAAAGANRRASLIALAIGLGLSQVLTGAVAPGLDWVWLRRIVCGLLLLQAMTLMSRSRIERWPLLTGGGGGLFASPETNAPRHLVRMTLLSILVGAIWIPPFGPTLGRASLMAADLRITGLSFRMLFVLSILLAFGIGAAIPWIALGRVVRLILRPFGTGWMEGMAGKRMLGLSFVIVAIVAGSGVDSSVARWLDARLPTWTTKLPASF